jgi:hypothetical protein
MYFNVCPQLIVRTDTGNSTNWDYKQISVCQCKALTEGKECKYKGNCVTAHNDNGTKINHNSKIGD